MIINCKHCNKEFEIKNGEVNRQIKHGRNYFFCSRSCSTKFGMKNKKTRFPIEKTCPICASKFYTVTGYLESTFCSRSCASRGSITDYRREKARICGKLNSKNLISTSKTLKKREFWKYVDIKSLLDLINEVYEFEFQLENYVFDLALLKRKIFIEFDGKNHNVSTQHELDNIKTECANNKGWKVIRIQVPTNSVINNDLIKEIFT